MQTVEDGEQAIVIEPADPRDGLRPLVRSNGGLRQFRLRLSHIVKYYASSAYYRAGGALAFGAGVALGAAWGGNCGYGFQMGEWRHQH